MKVTNFFNIFYIIFINENKTAISINKNYKSLHFSKIIFNFLNISIVQKIKISNKNYIYIHLKVLTLQIAVQRFFKSPTFVCMYLCYIKSFSVLNTDRECFSFYTQFYTIKILNFSHINFFLLRNKKEKLLDKNNINKKRETYTRDLSPTVVVRKLMVRA